MASKEVPWGSDWEYVDQFQEPNQPGWSLVEQSEELVVLDFTDAAQSAKLDENLEPGTEVVITGLETDSPMMRIDNTVMIGTWDQLFGSEIILKDTQPQEEEVSLMNQSQRSARLLQPLQGHLSPASESLNQSTTSQRITFQAVTEMDDIPTMNSS
ncbi:hypothetical protein MYAM1_003349 [Malassezia yamatoensis]|uniref:Transcription factor TFIIIC triple barrel domain-containing protein n=1 Tax=Malassezia yamatoensis TaxID=253288 RepID=A0AAJ5YZW1_9BASI|nr:hypothetical protein MYAM1_003349 [Malassezia yamatoensis]